jgi:hypothetical protein
MLSCPIGFTFAGASSLENVVSPFDDDSFSVDFSSELLAAFDFGGLELMGGSLFTFGSYENEYAHASFSFSVKSSVGVRNRNRHSRKKCRPNRQFRKKSVKKS